MEIAKIFNGVIAIAQFSDVFPRTSLPPAGPNVEFLAENNAYRVERVREFDQSTQTLEQVQPYLEGGVVYTVQAVNMTEEALRERLAFNVTEAIYQVDQQADQIIHDTVGSRVEEYKAAEAQAQAFADLAFEGPTPRSVQSHITSKAIEGVVFTPQTAAQDILNQAGAWREATEQIREQRLDAKARLRVAAANLDPAEGQIGYATAMAMWGGFVTAMRAALGIRPA